MLGVVFAIAGIRWSIWNKTQPVYKIGQTVTITMRLSQWPQESWSGKKISMKNWQIYLPKTDIARLVDYGQIVKVVGRISKKVIRGSNTQYVMIASDINILQEKGLRQKCLQMLRKWLPGDLGVLAAGILLGGSEGMSDAGKNAFKNVGMTHVVAASGYNVGVVAGWVMAIGWRVFGRRKAIPFVLLSIMLYIVLAGGSAAVVRAGLMAMATLTALSLGRPTDAGWWLALVGGGMLAIQPEWWGDVGFQLSVAAMAGLIWIEPRLVGKWQDMRTTIAAQITTTPIILHYFGNLSVAAPLMNGLLLWTVPPIMQISAIALAAGLVWEPAGRLISLTSWPLLWLLSEGTRWVGGQSWAAITVKPLDWWWLAVYYLALILIINLKRLRPATKEKPV